MDIVDQSEVGKFGTIRLLKQREAMGVVAAYPVDDDEVSFGRDSNCSVRLYYPEVSPLHCKIIFEDRKAILQVFGANGVLVDGCTVYPAKSSAVGFTATTVSVPLPNNSVFEIHKKRFLFNYPPKALRPQLFTPAAVRRKSVRMSLVQCAQVFSPAPSPYPRENLRVLQSPLKLGASDEPVTLVSTERPRVFEEEQDLVILEDTDEKANHPPSPTPVRYNAPPKTPRRSMPSLHRAVLIRSAQRNAIMREESERQKTFSQPQFTQISLDEDAEGETEEEDEVMNSILDDNGEHGGKIEQAAANNYSKNADMDTDPFVDKDHMQAHEQDITDTSMEVDNEELNEEEADTQLTPARTGPVRPLGAFMTPQLLAQRPSEETRERRRTGPQRPPPGYVFHDVLAVGHVQVKDEDSDNMDTDAREQHDQQFSPSKKRVSEEERKAILERRKSALSIPDPVIGAGFLSKTANAAPSLPSSSIPQPPASPFKALSADIEEGAETQAVLKRLENQVAERRASLSPTRPRINHNIAHDGEPLPSLTQTFSLLAPAARIFPFAGMKREEEATDLFSPVESTGSSGAGASTSAAQTTTGPETPRMEGLRNLFGRTQEPSGLETPAVRGVRALFRDAASTNPPETPRMDGLREMLAEPRVPPTPAFDGIGDMMQVDEGAHPLADVPEDVEGEAEYSEESALAEQAVPKGPPAQSKVPRRLPARSRVPTDTSNMADNEATPEILPKKSRIGPNISDAAVVHRASRGRKTASGSDSGKDETTKQAPTSPKRGRGTRVKTEESSSLLAMPPSKENRPTSRSRSRVASRSAATSGSDRPVADSSKKPPSRGKGRSTQSESDQPIATRRSTRGRSRSVDLDSDGDVEQPAAKAPKKSAIASTVEVIPEDDVLLLSDDKRRTAPKAMESRTRRTRTETARSTDEGSSSSKVRSVASTRRSTRVTGSESTVDERDNENKENTPEHSPTSESGAGEAEVDNTTAKTRAPGKSRIAIAKKTGTTAATTKKQATAGKSTKASATSDSDAVATRSLRTRTRK